MNIVKKYEILLNLENDWVFEGEEFAFLASIIREIMNRHSLNDSIYSESHGLAILADHGIVVDLIDVTGKKVTY